MKILSTLTGSRGPKWDAHKIITFYHQAYHSIIARMEFYSFMGVPFCPHGVSEISHRGS
jgi:hypothetical protein